MPARYAALRSYTTLASLSSLATKPDALDALCLAFRTEPNDLREGAFCALIVGLGPALARLSRRAADDGELLEALFVAASVPGCPLLLSISRDLQNERSAERRRTRREETVATLSPRATSPAASDPWLRRDVLRAVAQLSARNQRLCVLLGSGLSSEGAGAALGLKPVAARVAVLRLRERLRALGVTF